MKRRILALAAAAVVGTIAIAGENGRPPSMRNDDPCGLPDTTSMAYRLAATMNWGYGYDTLRIELAHWSTSPFVRVDSVGATVENRAIFLMTIQDTTVPSLPRKRVWIHARTHPNEVQGTWVTNQLITQLLGDTPFARRLRSECIFNIIPMINPDGVELQHARENAHNIDIESNWTAAPGEPEVQTLRRMFVQLMGEVNPIRVALNMHSAYGTSRYFVYHTPTGTSPAYAVVEQRFINDVRSYFPGGIQPYTYFVSWTTAPALQYPESWFWQNCGESVLALTYEDMNDVAARAFDSTANAILRGIADELGVATSVFASGGEVAPSGYALEQNYPNPFNPNTVISYQLSAASKTKISVYDMLGREIAVPVDETQGPGKYSLTFDGSRLASGVYIYRLVAGTFASSRRMILVK